MSKTKAITKKGTKTDFLAKCPPDSQPLFEEILTEAQERALVVYWGTVGFSIRVPLVDGSLHTVLRGFTPGNKGMEHPHIRCTVANVEDQELIEHVRVSLAQEAEFTEAGQYALHSDVHGETAANVRKGMQIVWHLAEQISRQV